MQQAMKKSFIRENCADLYKLTADLDELFAYVEAPVKDHTVKELKDG